MSSTGDRGRGGGSEPSPSPAGRQSGSKADHDAALADTLPARSGVAPLDATLPPSVVIAGAVAEAAVDVHAGTITPAARVDPYADTLSPRAERAAVEQTLPPESAVGAATLGPEPAVDPHGHTMGSAVVSVGDLSRLQSDFPVARWDRYEFQKKLGQGGMGAVYKARDRRLGRDVALKFIRGGDPNMVMRFLQEARAQARIDHPHVCKVYEVGEVEGKAYIAMQYVDGQSLHRAAKDLSLTEKVLLMRQVSEAMHEAHRLGIIHRDLKPDNIMVERLADGTMSPVVMDFGLAREAGDNRGLTESGAVMGTPAYMAPEQARGDVRTLDRRADVYSLGATLYDLIAGVPPFDAQSVVDVLLQVMNEDAVPLRVRLPSVPADLETIVMKCLRKEPGARYDSAKALADDLQRYIDGEPIQGRRESVIGRVRRRAKKNLALVFVSAVSLVLVAGCAVQWVRVQLAAKRDRERAAELVKLERQLGQDIKEMEWFLRSAYQLPLHDITPQLAIVRQRMAAMDGQRAALRGDDGGRIDYAIGRGHLALHEPAEALRHLQQAKARGLDMPELHYALGRALGERFQQALEEARRQGDKTWVEKRRKELEAQYLQPAVQELEKSRGGTLDSPEYLEGLIAFYRKQYDLALEKAKTAFAKYPWLYEAKALEARVYSTNGIHLCDSGGYADGASMYELSIGGYKEAIDIGRSDVIVYEELADAIKLKSTAKFDQGKDFIEETKNILQVAEKTTIINSLRSKSYIQKSNAYFWLGFMKGASAQDPRSDFKKSIENASRAIEVESNNASAHDMIGNGNYWYGAYEKDNGRDPLPYWERADAAFRAAIQAEARFPWAHNDYGLLLQGRGGYFARLGLDWKSELRRSILSFHNARLADPSYGPAYINELGSYYSIVELMSGAGENLDAAVADALSLYELSNKINMGIVLIHYNMANILIKCAESVLESGGDAKWCADGIPSVLMRLRSIDGDGLLADMIRLRADKINLMRTRQMDGEFVLAVKRMANVADSCRKKPGYSGDCESILAEAFLIQAERLGFGSKEASTSIERAFALAEHAVSINPNDSELTPILVSATVARMRWVLKKPQAALIAEAIQLANKVLASRPYNGRNHGNLAALYVLRFRDNPRTNRADLQSAKEHFQQAIKRSPRLEKVYGKSLQEVEALLAQQGGGK